ncbi:MAG: sensor histidine kinase [Clostridia bacterium]|nr:sensor histidine kinase [Clostridia bacterium]
MQKKQFFLIKAFIIILIGWAFITLENVEGKRLIQLLCIFMALNITNVLRASLKSPFKISLLAVDLIFFILLSLLSRYVINYFLYALYIMAVIEAGLFYDFRQARYIIGMIFLSSGYHYVVLYHYRPNLGIVSEIIFMLLIYVLLTVSLYFLQVANKEREKQRLLNEQLQEINNKLENLTRLAVKTDIAREIHDTFGHDMMGLIMQIEMADVLINQDPDGAKRMLKDAKNSARQGMKTIRQVVETLRADEGDIITETVDMLLDGFEKKSNIMIEKDVDEKLYDYPKKIHDVMYRTIQESITNSVRHGQASHIVVWLSCEPSYINFRIKDNGVGADTMHLGYGLRGMKERLSKFNGNVRFKSEEGFEVKGYIEVTK